MATKTFLHSGDMGDILYSCAAIKAVCGEEYRAILYLDANGGLHDKNIWKQLGKGNRLKFDERGAYFLCSILTVQPYIEEVKLYRGEMVDYNFNEIRTKLRPGIVPTIAQMYMDVVGVQKKAEEMMPWLTVNPIKDRFYVENWDKHKPVISRSPRYQCAHIWWEKAIAEGGEFEYADFVGTEQEYDSFCLRLRCDKNKITFYRTDNALQLAYRLAAAEKYAGNQSMPMSMRIGLGLPYIQECYRDVGNCIFDVQHGKYVYE